MHVKLQLFEFVSTIRWNSRRSYAAKGSLSAMRRDMAHGDEQWSAHMDLCTFELLLPPSPPLGGRWECHRCNACGAETQLDLRVRHMPIAGVLARMGWARVRCYACGGTDLRFEGVFLS
jgi:hypothetical protein